MSRWREIEKELSGRFEARATGLLGREFILSGGGGEFGTIEGEGLSGAVISLDGVEARVKRDGRRGYRMSSGREELLEVRTSPAASPVLLTGDGCYEASLALLRNRASARLRGDGEALRLNGGLTGHAYRVEMGGDGVLPAALFLLYYLAELRRRVFRARV